MIRCVLDEDNATQGFAHFTKETLILTDKECPGRSKKFEEEALTQNSAQTERNSKLHIVQLM